MRSIFANRSFSRRLRVMGFTACVILFSAALLAAQQTAAKTVSASVGGGIKGFDTPQQAADAVVAAAEKFDQRAFEEIFGPDGDDIVLSGEYPQDRQLAS